MSEQSGKRKEEREKETTNRVPGEKVSHTEKMGRNTVEAMLSNDGGASNAPRVLPVASSLVPCVELGNRHLVDLQQQHIKHHREVCWFNHSV